MGTRITVTAADLPKYVGHKLVGFGRINQAGIVDGFVLANTGEGFGIGDRKFYNLTEQFEVELKDETSS